MIALTSCTRLILLGSLQGTSSYSTLGRGCSSFQPPLKGMCWFPRATRNAQSEFQNLHPRWVSFGFGRSTAKQRWFLCLTYPFIFTLKFYSFFLHTEIWGAWKSWNSKVINLSKHHFLSNNPVLHWISTTGASCFSAGQGTETFAGNLQQLHHSIHTCRAFF